MALRPEDYRFIAEHPATVQALADIEHEATERTINCPPADDMARRIAVLEVRAIRALRARLAAMSQPAAEPAKGPSPYA